MDQTLIAQCSRFNSDGTYFRMKNQTETPFESCQVDTELKSTDPKPHSSSGAMPCPECNELN